MIYIYIQNNKETAEITGTHNEEVEFRDFDAQER